MSDNHKEIVLGIDLGTTFSCVSVYQGGESKVLENKEGKRTTPSVVAFVYKDSGSAEMLVGGSAVRQMNTNVDNSFYVTKRFMGMQNGEEVKILKEHPVHYKVVNGSNGIAFEDGKKKTYTPEQIGAFILKYLKESAADALGVSVNQVKKAVITVPAYFSDSQRHATKNAGKIAGLDVIRIINEPTAAALAYGLDKKKDANIAVFDLGGGTFDVSILEISGDGVFEVKASLGDAFLGGSDFDQRITDYLIEEFQKSNNINLKNDQVAYSRIRTEAERAKIDLSSTNSVDVNIPFIHGPHHLNVSLTRSKLESLCEDLLKKTEEPCRQALKDSGVDKIDEVILIGGMTRMPKITEIVRKIFGKDPLKNINPDEAVAKGASIQGAILAGDVEQDVLLLDVTPMSLGIETLGGILTPMIKKQTTIPTRKSQVFSTAYDNQSGVLIRVFQGERKLANDNKLLGSFTLEGIAPAPKGVPQIEVIFDIDANGIIHVSAVDLATKKEQKIRVESNRMSEEEIQKHMEEVKRFEEEDQKKIKLIEAKNQADAAIYSAEKTLKEHGDKVDSAIKEEIEAVKNTLSETMKGDDCTAIEDQTKTLNEKLQKIGESLYQKNNNSTEPQGQDGQENNANQQNSSDAKDDDIIDNDNK